MSDIETPFADGSVTPGDALRVYLAEGGRSVSKTANLIGLNRRTAYRWAITYDWKHQAAPEQIPDLSHLAPPSPAVLARLEDLDRIRDEVRAKLYRAADAAADVLIQTSRGEVIGGDFGQMGNALVRPAVRMQAAKSILELAGLTPPKRVEITKVPDRGYDNLRTVAARLTVTELEILVTGLERTMKPIEATAEVQGERP